MPTNRRVTTPPNRVQPKAVRKPRTSVRKTDTDFLQERGIDQAVVIGADTPLSVEVMEQLCKALEVADVQFQPAKRVTKRTQIATSSDGSKHQQKRRSAGKPIRPASDDPSEMLGPLADPIIEDDDDEESPNAVETP